MKEGLENKLKNGPRGLGLMIFLFILVFLIGTGAGLVSGFYFGKKQAPQNSESTNKTATKVDDGQKSNTEKAKDTTGFQEYTVQAGDTLFKIGLKFDLPWTKIAEANGLSEESVIVEGQVLKIPIEGSNNKTKNFTINKDAMTKIQADVDDGENLWYLDPVEVAKYQVPGTFEISAEDAYTLKSKNTAVGEAIVEVVHELKIYQITLTQPVKKGNSGIWAVQKVARI